MHDVLRPIMSFLCLGLSLADTASWAAPVASGESRGPLDLVPWPATSLCAYVPEVGKRCSGLMPIVCPIRRRRRSITVTCIAGGTASGRQCPLRDGMDPGASSWSRAATVSRG
jgi:hypothetical protein